MRLSTRLRRVITALHKGAWDRTDDIGQTSYFADGGTVTEAIEELEAIAATLKREGK